MALLFPLIADEEEHVVAEEIVGALVDVAIKLSCLEVLEIFYENIATNFRVENEQTGTAEVENSNVTVGIFVLLVEVVEFFVDVAITWRI